MDDLDAIGWVSPSAVARLQACGLAESRRRGPSKDARPSNPVARLGNAAHRVLEWIARSAPELNDRGDAEERIASRWREEVELETQASQSNPLERSYGPAERWPGYGRIAAGVRADGVALAQELAGLPVERRLPERAMQSSDRTIRGTADLVVLDEDGSALVIDHKAGEVSDEDVAPGGRHEQQVLLYAALARDSGLWATKAEIRPLGRATRPVELSEARLTAVVNEAHAEMARYNQAVAQGRVIDLANPSQSSCAWCPFILDCPAVWVSPAPDLGDDAVIEGDVEAIQALPSSLALKLRTVDGTVTVTGVSTEDISGRRPTVGDRMRLAGLRQTSPGVMRCRPGRSVIAVL